MKYSLWIVQSLLLLLTMAACEKDDSNGPEFENDKYRVKKIIGHNELWQDYVMECGYKNQRLDSAIIYHHGSEMASLLYMTYAVDEVTAQIYDLVPAVDADSIAKLDPDSIPYAMETAMVIKISLDQNKRIKSEHLEYWRQKDQVPGEDYEFRYEKKEQIDFLYEYNQDGKLVIWRSPNYRDEVRKAKCEYQMEGNNVLKSILSYYEGSDWNPIMDETFSYSGQRVVSWQCGQIRADYSYAGNQVSEVNYSDGEKVTYQYNSDGLVSRITSSNGDYQQITYEAGAGNFYLFSLPHEKVYQLPTGLGCLGRAAYIPYYER